MVPGLDTAHQDQYDTAQLGRLAEVEELSQGQQLMAAIGLDQGYEEGSVPTRLGAACGTHAAMTRSFWEQTSSSAILDVPIQGRYGAEVGCGVGSKPPGSLPSFPCPSRAPPTLASHSRARSSWQQFQRPQ